jgi:xylose isomerase
MTRFFGPEQPISYEGPGSKNPLAFKYYDPDKKVLGKRMKDHLRFAVCYWHSFVWPGTDPFGGDSFQRPWMQAGDPLQLAHQKADVAFEMFRLLRVPFFTFHDRDVAPEGSTIAESNRNVRQIAELFARKMEENKVGLLWATADIWRAPPPIPTRRCSPTPPRR